MRRKGSRRGTSKKNDKPDTIAEEQQATKAVQIPVEDGDAADGQVAATAGDDDKPEEDTGEAQSVAQEPGEAPAGSADQQPPEQEDDIHALNDRLLRLQADFENFRRRTLREKGELYRRANEGIIQEFLPVLDNLELALGAADTHDAPPAFVEGFRLVSEQMLGALGKFGVAPVEAEGKEFDPNRHEAMSRMVSDTAPENTVLTQLRSGYMIGDRLLRATQVIVSSGKEEADG